MKGEVFVIPTNWMDMTDVSFRSLFLLERIQLSWLPGWLREDVLAIALAGNPEVEWYMRNKCPELIPWLDHVMEEEVKDSLPLREAELYILRQLDDLLVYVLKPELYDSQPFLNWDSRELTEIADFRAKRVVDIGAGTGRLTLTVAALAREVFAVEPVANLRRYLLGKADKAGLANVYATDGEILRLPFPNDFADITMGGHVFGDDPHKEHKEMERVTRPGGMIIHCPGNGDVDNSVHSFLVESGYRWARFEQPRDGIKRKYWKQVQK